MPFSDVSIVKRIKRRLGVFVLITVPCRLHMPSFSSSQLSMWVSKGVKLPVAIEGEIG